MKFQHDYNKHHKSILYILVLAFFMSHSSGCGLFKRKSQQPESVSDSAEHPKHDVKESTPATSSAPDLPNPDLSSRSYALAKDQYDLKKWPEAIQGLSGFLSDYPGAPMIQRNDAKTMLAISYANAGHCDQAIPLLRTAIENQNAYSNQTAPLIFLQAQCYSSIGSTDQALAATHEIVPDRSLLARLALPPEQTNKNFRRVKSTLNLQNQTLLFRAKLLAERGDLTAADETLLRAKRMLNTARGYGITNEQAKALQGELSLRELEILPHRCLKQHPMPSVADEATALDFINRYYACVDSARVLLCDVYRIGSSQQFNDSKLAYTRIVQVPGSLDQLPPSPTRKLPDESSRSFFSKEWSQFVHMQVDSKIRDYNSIQECGLSGIF